jgi:hypothetical protein
MGAGADLTSAPKSLIFQWLGRRLAGAGSSYRTTIKRHSLDARGFTAEERRRK